MEWTSTWWIQMMTRLLCWLRDVTTQRWRWSCYPDRQLYHRMSLTSKTQELTSAAESGNWTLLDDLLSSDDVTRCDIEQSYILHRLAAAPVVSLSLARDIIAKIIKHQVDINMMGTNEDTAIVVAARCDNTKMVMELLSRQAALPQDVTHVCSFLQTLTKNWKQEETPYMHALVVKLLWDRLQDTALHTCHKELHDTLVRLAVTFHTSLVREMFVTEQQVNTLDSEGMAVLHRLAMFDNDDHVRLVHVLVRKGANINLKNTTGDTPLHVATKHKSWKMLEALLRHQAVSYLLDSEQRSVLHIVASFTEQNSHYVNHLFRLLIRNSYNINIKDGKGNTALHLAALAGNISLMKILLDHGARADGVNDEQKTVLHMMAMTSGEVLSDFRIHVFLLTIKRGAEIHKTDCDGNSALHLAAKHENWALVEFLLRYVDDASQPDSEGFNILHRYAMKPYRLNMTSPYEVPRKVGDINTRCRTGETAIHLAAKYQNWQIVKLLAEECVITDELDNEGFCILHRMAMDKKIDDSLLTPFIEVSINPRSLSGDTVLHLAARHENWQLVKRLVELVDDIDERDSEGLTVIQRLVMSKDKARLHVPLFSRLLELGADYTCRDQNGDTVLHLAARNGQWEIVRYLVELGQRTDTPDSEGFVILHRAVMVDTGDSSAKDMLRCILKSNPELNKRTKHGDTAIHLAAKYERWETVMTLVEHGANVFDCESENISVLQQIVKCQSSCPLALPILQKTVGMHKTEHHYNLYKTLACEAARCSKWHLMQYLTDLCGISIRQLTLDGLSLLHILAQTKFTEYPHQTISELFKHLLDKGMKLEDTCPNGNTPLHLAAKSGNWHLVKYLVEQGATIQSPDSEGVLVLQRLAMYSDYCENQRVFLRLLIKRGADVKVRDSNGNSLLHLGGKANNWSFVWHLIQETDDLDWEELDHDGFNMLHRLALSDKSSEWIEKVLNKSFNLEASCSNGDICLLLAAKRENWEFVKRLLECILHKKKPLDSMLKRLSTRESSFNTMSSHRLGLDDRVAVQRILNKRDVFGYTVWHLAIMRKQWDIIELLAECGANTDNIDDEGLDVLQRLASDSGMNFRSVANWNNFLKFLKEKGLSFDRKDGLGNSPVQRAAKIRNLDFVTLLLDHVNDVLSKDSDGLPLLYRLVHSRNSYEHAKIMERLLQLGADPQELFWDGNTLLHLAAKKNEWAVVRLLLKHGARSSTCDSEGLSVLHRLACPGSGLLVNSRFNVFASSGLPSLIETLLQSGANLNQRDLEGNTPLHLAVHNQKWDLVFSLVYCEAEVNELDSEGYTVLHRLAQIPRPIESCLSVIRLLLKKDARYTILSRRRENLCDIIAENESWDMFEYLLQINSLTAGIREDDDKTLLHHLASSYFGDQHTFVCDQLLERGFSVNFTDYEGNTPLHLAARTGNWYLVEHLIQRGGIDKTLDRKGMSILRRFINDIKSNRHFYSRDPLTKNLSDVLQTIISSGTWFLVNAADLQGNTALHIAAKRRLFTIVEKLIDKVDNLNTRDSEGFTVLLRLSQIPDPRCLRICQDLVKKGADINIHSTDGESALELAVKNNNWPVVEFLFSNGALFDVQAMENHFPMHRLIKSSSSSSISSDIQLKLMILLTNNGLSVNMPDPDGDMPAKLAFRHKKWNLLTYLLNSGAHLNPTSTKRNSYLHELAKNPSADGEVANITRLLINRGLDINLQNSVGDTPAHVAADEGNLKIVKTFVEHGADTNIPDRKGCFLLYKIINKLVHERWGVLSTCKITEILRTLVNHGADVNCRGPNNKTVLQVAAGKEDWEMVGMLNQLGGVCELTPDEKLSALRLLDRCGWKDVDDEKINLFIKYITNDGSNINSSFQDKSRYDDQKTVLQNCIEKSNWRMAKALVECGADISQMNTNDPILQLMISRHSESDHSAWVYFLDYLISRGLDINSKLREGSGILFHDKIMSSLTREEKVTGCLFDTLLERGADPLVVDTKGQTLLRAVLDFGEKRALNALKKLLPTGVTTHQQRFTETIVQSSSKQTVSPIKKVLEDQNISALKILIKSGASSNAELFRLSTEYQGTLGRRANKGLLEVLNMATSQPQSLKSLCRLTVSHCVGCGPGRSDKLNRLPILPALRQLVSFDDLLS